MNNKSIILGLCGRITASSDKSERARLAKQLLSAADAMGDKLTDELVNEITAALKPANDSTDVRGGIINDLNESLRKEGNYEARRGILTAMMKLRNQLAGS